MEAGVFPARVELWQIGPRDRAKLVGGLGPCGQELCCERFLADYPKATIKMAKDQDMPLGPNAATGFCGRPLCCLAYEQSTYQAARGRVPRVGEIVTTARGGGRRSTCGWNGGSCRRPCSSRLPCSISRRWP